MKNKKGFVIFLIIFVTLVAAISIAEYISWKTLPKLDDETRTDFTKIQIAIDEYYENVGKYPSSLEELPVSEDLLINSSSKQKVTYYYDAFGVGNQVELRCQYMLRASTMDPLGEAGYELLNIKENNC